TCCLDLGTRGFLDVAGNPDPAGAARVARRGCGGDGSGAAVRAIIVDDEAAARKTLRERCAAQQDIEVVGEYADAESALAALPQQAPDLIFLDVKMGRVSGIQFAQALELGSAPLVVFVTAFDRYALQAFEVNAADFLLKPFDRARFRTMLWRVRERYAARNSANYQIAAATLAELQRLSQTRREARPRPLAETRGGVARRG